MYPVKARVERISGFSAHADRSELLKWMSTMPNTPKRVFVTHGEPEASAALKELIEAKTGWCAEVPAFGDTVELQ